MKGRAFSVSPMSISVWEYIRMRKRRFLPGGQKEAVRCLELNLEVLASYLTWAMGSKLQPLYMTGTLHLEAISATLLLSTFYLWFLCI